MVNICQPSACENNTECKNGNDLLPCQLLAYDLPHSKSELPLEHRKWPVVIQWVLSIVNTLKEQMTISRTNSVHFFFYLQKVWILNMVVSWWCFMLLVSNISTRIRFSVGFGGLVWIHVQLSHDQQLMCYIFTPFFSRYGSKGINHTACSWLPRKDLNPYSKQLWLKAMIFSMISRC